MAETQITIDPATVFDNVDDRRIEFAGEASGDTYDFALQYDVLEALAGEVPTDPVPLFQRHADAVAIAATAALARDPAQPRIVVSENDLA
ncbi:MULTISPECIES: hypothetical protein [unclassified Sphingomonas]|uniref:hypothetical protein n=1 Tax=unclassified Sphingomonas TaxID=196159 RepID=UPI000E10B40E|nr:MULTISPECIES: hypothetical protein [unclassified Sphingomonas]AXJ97036.1 hypothetical protein DM480_11185 [Sphingomonas sp. FARSPH]